jgi:hypothetical protein
MSNLLTDIFSSISADKILEAGRRAKISKKKVDQISFDAGELFISTLAKKNRSEKKSEVFFQDFEENKKNTIDLFFNKDTKKVIKVLAKKNNEVEKKIEEFISALSDLVYFSLSNIFKKTNMNAEIFSQIIKISEEKQKMGSIERNGILSILDLNKNGFIRDDVFDFFKNIFLSKIKK